LVRKAVESLGITKNVYVMDFSDVEKLTKQKDLTIVVPNEDVTKQFVEEFFPKTKIEFENIFLRWDRHNSTAESAVNVDQKISLKEFDKEIIQKVRADAASGSSDWWRRVGAAVINDKKIILEGYNKHVPSAHTPYANGDPRNAFHKGVNIDLSTALHAEAGLIAEAARQGINLSCCSMYVSTFPCPSCAKLIAYSGISRVFYTGGYGVLDAESILKSQDVEIIFVDLG